MRRDKKIQYKKTTMAAVAATALANCWRPAYLRSLAQATKDWQWQNAPRPLKRVTLDKLLPAPQEIYFDLAPQSVGETTIDDLVAVCALIRVRQPQTIFEFGTLTGNTTLCMTMNAPATARVFTLDLPGTSTMSRRYQQSPCAARITQCLGDSREFDTAPHAGKMDFIFIDANHAYEFVVSDSKKAFEMLAEDGIIAWHDYAPGFIGVHKYLEDLAQTREVFWIEGTWVAFCRGRG